MYFLGFISKHIVLAYCIDGVVLPFKPIIQKKYEIFSHLISWPTEGITFHKDR